MKRFLFIVAITMAAQYALAQGEQATVYMRDGRVIQGNLEQSNTGRYIFRCAKGTIFSIKRTGRLYGEEPIHYYYFDGERLQIATEDERINGIVE